jgi:hypothetical protein
LALRSDYDLIDRDYEEGSHASCLNPPTFGYRAHSSPQKKRQVTVKAVGTHHLGLMPLREPKYVDVRVEVKRSRAVKIMRSIIPSFRQFRTIAVKSEDAWKYLPA